MEVRDHLEEAIKRAGSEAKLGEATGFSQNAIWQAKKRGRVSPKMALAIHRFTHGEVPASVLRPDLWPTRQHVPNEAQLQAAQ
jgi:DNA-binding transcriptional regulator YdaS (Cro superfamily)